MAVHHRRRRRHAEPVRLAHDVEPLVGLRLLRRDDRADAVDEDLGAAAGDRVEAGVAEPRQRLRDGQLRAPRDVLDLGRRERVQVDRVARLDRAEEVLVVVDPEVGVVAALHEEPGAADRERLLDLLVDHRLRQQVPLAHVARAPVEGAEVAVGDADVRVVEVPVDDERDLRRVGHAGCGARSRRGRPRRDRASASSAIASSSVIRSPSSAFSRTSSTAGSGSAVTVTRRPPRARSAARARGRARRRRVPSRGRCRGRRARAARSCSGASRSSGRGSPADSRTLARLLREPLRLASAPAGPRRRARARAR